jgi:hypothetical protein
MAETKNDGGTIVIRIIILLIPMINVIAALLWAASPDEGTRKFGKIAILILLLIVLMSFLFGVYGLFSLKGTLFA